jgi:hypothetical protein
MFSARFIVVLIACFSVGLHWGALQMVGWVSMTVEFARTTTISEALEKTFDGEHPCALCLAVQDRGMPADEHSPANPKTKAEPKPLVISLWEAPVFLITSASSIASWPGIHFPASGLKDRPPVPPPRRGTV